MKFTEFQKHTPRRPSHAYVFICGDGLLIDESRPVWRRIFGGDWGFEKLSAKEFEAIDPARLAEWALSAPLFGPRRALLVDDAGKISKKRRELVEEIAGFEESSLKIILLAASRRSLASLSRASRALPVIEIEPFRPGDTVRWLSTRYGASAEVAKHLIDSLGMDLSCLHFEMDKLSTYVRGLRPVEVADVERLVFGTQRFGPFELEDAVLEQAYPKSVRVAGAMIEEGLEPVVLLFRLARVWRQILVGKAMAGTASASDIAAAASVPDWKAARFSAACVRFDWSRVVRGFQALAVADRAFKTGSPNVRVTVDVLLWKLIG